MYYEQKTCLLNKFYLKDFTVNNYKGYTELDCYKHGRELRKSISLLVSKFPKEEKYSLTDQIRRSARSVCACIGESYRKRLYPAHFISKLSDSDMENSETQVWLDFAFECEYLDKESHEKLTEKVKEVGKLLNYMSTIYWINMFAAILYFAILFLVTKHK